MNQAPSLLFVCTGNICRSAMAEQVARDWASRAGVRLRADSAGTSAEESGNPIDSRAARVLGRHDYPVGNHRARQVAASDLADFDLVLAFEPHHLRRLQALAPQASNVRLVSDFNPLARPGSGIADPWYGGIDGFEDTLAAVEAALPGVFAELGYPQVRSHTGPRLASDD